MIQSVQRWVSSFVVDMNLCPFAKRELVNDRVHFSITDAETEEQLLVALQHQCQLLNQENSIETTMLIHPNVLRDFYEYNQFLDVADMLLNQMGLEGVYQIASFHPDYQFAETLPSDAENYTNRSPYPILHLLREESLSRAIANYNDVDQIPLRNRELMNKLGSEQLAKLFQSYFLPAA